ncbi:MAG: LPS export ABC transporter periplasmic protein LptC [Hyphomicrobiales bacterium]
MKRSYYKLSGKLLFKSIVMVFAITMLFACENNLNEVYNRTKEASWPGLSAYDFQLERLDSGKIVLKLNTPLMEKYDGDSARTVFPKGFKAIIYDKNEKPESDIRGDYGINYEQKDVLEARGNVILMNFESEQKLYTELLIWDENTKKVYSPVPVKLVSPDGIAYGDSMVSNQDLSNRNIYNFRGDFDVPEQDTISSDTTKNP